MKKIIFFAAILLGLVACNKEMAGNIESETSGKAITLTASVNFGEPETKVAPNDTNSYGAGYNVAFHWQEGDKVLLVSGEDSSTFTIVSSSISTDGKTAKFTGMPLSDMSSYMAFYAGKNTNVATYGAVFSGSDSTTTVALDNVTGGYNVVAVNLDTSNPNNPKIIGNESGFTLCMFLNTFRLKLKGDVTLGKVEYLYDYDGTSETPLSVINFGTDGLKLSTTAQEVWIPATLVPTQRATFRFYDKGENLIMSKPKAKNFTSYGTYGNLISFPELEVKPVLLSGKFSVSSEKKVRFTRGNLYWDDVAFYLESSQTAYPTSWSITHVGHFYWTKTAAASYAESYSDGTCTKTDKFFADGSDADHMLTIDGQSGLYALSRTEWCYLLNYDPDLNQGEGGFKTDGNVRQDKFKFPVTVNGNTNCLVIAPDGYSGTIAESYDAAAWATAEASGLVCLPAAASRSGSNLGSGGSYGYYWSATPSENGNDKAGLLGFNNKNGVKPSGYEKRSNGGSIRLVSTASKQDNQESTGKQVYGN